MHTTVFVFNTQTWSLAHLTGMQTPLSAWAYNLDTNAVDRYQGSFLMSR